MKKLKIKIRGFLIFKIIKLEKEIRAYRKKIADNALIEQQYIDKMKLLEIDVRDLLLKLSKDERELWLKERNKKNERHTPKKK